jgi:uncharacterized membrane protein YsdA (DUF1294 family)
MTIVAAAYVAVVFMLSVVAFALYGLDKRRARSSGRRIPENTLHLLALFGGWPGALLGQRVFRHKTQKLSFRLVFWGCVIVHLAVLVGAIYLFYRHG